MQDYKLVLPFLLTYILFSGVFFLVSHPYFSRQLPGGGPFFQIKHLPFSWTTVLGSHGALLVRPSSLLSVVTLFIVYPMVIPHLVPSPLVTHFSTRSSNFVEFIDMGGHPLSRIKP